MEGGRKYRSLVDRIYLLMSTNNNFRFLPPSTSSRHQRESSHVPCPVRFCVAQWEVLLRSLLVAYHPTTISLSFAILQPFFEEDFVSEFRHFNGFVILRLREGFEASKVHKSRLKVSQLPAQVNHHPHRLAGCSKCRTCCDC